MPYGLWKPKLYLISVKPKKTNLTFDSLLYTKYYVSDPIQMCSHTYQGVARV